METNEVKHGMKEAIRQRIGGMASEVFTTRVNRMIDELSVLPAEMDAGLNNVRILIKLHFDDVLSEDVYRQLQSLSMQWGVPAGERGQPLSTKDS